MMQDTPTTPRSRQKKSGLLAGAKAYLGVSGRKSSERSTELPRAKSETSLRAPETPSRKAKNRKSESSPKPKKPSSLSSRRSVDDEVPGDPQTPRARQKIRRAATSETNTGGPVVQPRGDESGSFADSTMAVSPTKKKKKRPVSLGPMKSEKNRDDATVKSRESRASSKDKKKKRHNSAGPMSRERSRRSSRRSPNPSHSSLNALTEHLDGMPMPMPSEEMLPVPEDSSGRRQSRTTVGNDGRIRRVKNSESGVSSDEDETKSKQSTSSKLSKRSSKSTGTKKSASKKSTSKDSKRVKSPKPASSSSDLGRDSEHSEPSTRTDRSAGSRSTRRAGKRLSKAGDVSENASSLPSLDFPKPDEGHCLSNVATSPQRQVSDIGNGFDDSFGDMVLAKAKEPTAARTASLEEEVARLNKKIIELNEDNLKVQFAAQSEAGKLRKELREEKLELQHNQTQRRELRAELRERDLIIDESDRKIQALEKAVESQLDKVDDLEEELRRANEEIFDLEGKLGDMGRVLADSSAVETNALQKEKEFDEKREERMQRRLEEREMELTKREMKLREERDAMVKESQPRREIEQLEQDNRMLLKALNRERAEGADKGQELDEEIKRLEQALKRAEMESYTQVESGSTDGNIAKLLQNNKDLQQNLDEEKEKASAAMRKKDEMIASLENELKNHGGTREMNGTGDSDSLVREIETLKGDFLVLKSKLEGAQRRNQLLEEDIDHWKSVNCNLEDEVAEWKAQVTGWRGKYEDAVDASVSSHASEPVLPYDYSQKRGLSAAEMALGRKDDDDDVNTIASEPANSIANLWSKLTTPTAKRSALDSDSVNEVIARTTFH